LPRSAQPFLQLVLILLAQLLPQLLFGDVPIFVGKFLLEQLCHELLVNPTLPTRQDVGVLPEVGNFLWWPPEISARRTFPPTSWHIALLWL
jgi:hypothetical protein